MYGEVMDELVEQDEFYDQWLDSLYGPDYGEDDHDDYFDYYEEFLPHYSGGSQEKRWWMYSRRDSGLEHRIRRRQRDWENYYPNRWKHGRDLPDKWETGDLKNRDEHRDFYRRERRKTRRNRRDSMRFWGADYTPPLGEAHLDAFVA